MALLDALSVLLFLSLAPTHSSQCSLSEAARYESRQCSSDLISEAVAASELSSCQPRPLAVRLPWPNNTEVHQMTPTHVEVSRLIISIIVPRDSCCPPGVPVPGWVSLRPRSEVVCPRHHEAEVSAGDAGQVWAGGGALRQGETD